MRPAKDEPSILVAFEYEVWMFFRTRALLAAHVSNEHQESKVLDNALEESALIHTRILAEVLLNRCSEVGDVTLDDLVPSWRELPGAGGAIRQLRQTYGRPNENGTPCWQLNKMLAHFTAVRSSSFDYSDLRAKLDPLITKALRAIARELNSPKINQFLEAHTSDSAQDGHDPPGAPAAAD